MSRRSSSGRGTGAAVAVVAGLYLSSTMHPHGSPAAQPPAHHHHDRASLTSMPQGNGGTPSQNRALANAMAARRGWTGAQTQCLDTLWMGESAFDQFNTYPSHDTSPSTPGSQITTAYGIPQALPAQKMAAAGADWQTNPRTQIRWGLGYIQATYGYPCTALNFKTTHGNKGY